MKAVNEAFIEFCVIVRSSVTDLTAQCLESKTVN